MDRPAITTYRNVHLIHNPTAGRLQRGGSAIVPSASRVFQAEGAAVTECPTSAPGDATRLAREAVASEADLVVVAGGDGTLNEVLNGLVHSRVPLAVVPCGTANVLANEMGLPRNPIRAAQAIFAQDAQRIAVGLLQATGEQPRYFLLMAGIGLDAHIVKNVDLDLKKWLGKLAYWLGGFGQLGRQFPQFHVVVNGEQWASSFTLAARVRNYGGDIEIAKSASLLEDCFELVSFAGQDSFRYLSYLTGVLTNSLDKLEGVSVRKVSRVEFTLKGDQPTGDQTTGDQPTGEEPTGDEQILIQVDGELAGRLPASVEIIPDAVTLLMPPTIEERYRSNG